MYMQQPPPRPPKKINQNRLDQLNNLLKKESPFEKGLKEYVVHFIKKGNTVSFSNSVVFDFVTSDFIDGSDQFYKWSVDEEFRQTTTYYNYPNTLNFNKDDRKKYISFRDTYYEIYENEKNKNENPKTYLDFGTFKMYPINYYFFKETKEEYHTKYENEHIFQLVYNNEYAKTKETWNEYKQMKPITRYKLNKELFEKIMTFKDNYIIKPLVLRESVYSNHLQEPDNFVRTIWKKHNTDINDFMNKSINDIKTDLRGLKDSLVKLHKSVYGFHIKVVYDGEKLRLMCFDRKIYLKKSDAKHDDWIALYESIHNILNPVSSNEKYSEVIKYLEKLKNYKKYAAYMAKQKEEKGLYLKF